MWRRARSVRNESKKLTRVWLERCSVQEFWEAPSCGGYFDFKSKIETPLKPKASPSNHPILGIDDIAMTVPLDFAVQLTPTQIWDIFNSSPWRGGRGQQHSLLSRYYFFEQRLSSSVEHQKLKKGLRKIIANNQGPFGDDLSDQCPFDGTSKEAQAYRSWALEVLS